MNANVDLQAYFSQSLPRHLLQRDRQSTVRKVVVSDGSAGSSDTTDDDTEPDEPDTDDESVDDEGDDSDA